MRRSHRHCWSESWSSICATVGLLTTPYSSACSCPPPASRLPLSQSLRAHQRGDRAIVVGFCLECGNDGRFAWPLHLFQGRRCAALFLARRARASIDVEHRGDRRAARCARATNANERTMGKVASIQNFVGHVHKVLVSIRASRVNVRGTWYVSVRDVSCVTND